MEALRAHFLNLDLDIKFQSSKGNYIIIGYITGKHIYSGGLLEKNISVCEFKSVLDIVYSDLSEFQLPFIKWDEENELVYYYSKRPFGKVAYINSRGRVELNNFTSIDDVKPILSEFVRIWNLINL